MQKWLPSVCIDPSIVSDHLTASADHLFLFHELCSDDEAVAFLFARHVADFVSCIPSSEKIEITKAEKSMIRQDANLIIKL